MQALARDQLLVQVRRPPVGQLPEEGVHQGAARGGAPAARDGAGEAGTQPRAVGLRQRVRHMIDHVAAHAGQRRGQRLRCGVGGVRVERFAQLRWIKGARESAGVKGLTKSGAALERGAFPRTARTSGRSARRW